MALHVAEWACRLVSWPAIPLPWPRPRAALPPQLTLLCLESPWALLDTVEGHSNRRCSRFVNKLLCRLALSHAVLGYFMPTLDFMRAHQHLSSPYLGDSKYVGPTLGLPFPTEPIYQMLWRVKEGLECFTVSVHMTAVSIQVESFSAYTTPSVSIPVTP